MCHPRRTPGCHHWRPQIATVAFLDEFIVGHFHSMGILRTARNATPRCAVATVVSQGPWRIVRVTIGSEAIPTARLVKGHLWDVDVIVATAFFLLTSNSPALAIVNYNHTQTINPCMQYNSRLDRVPFLGSTRPPHDVSKDACRNRVVSQQYWEITK